MAQWYEGDWPRYVPVAERREKAKREIAKLRKKGHPVAPVTIEGRTIARTFWGKAWCDSLESYQDYENRLPRGRTYVRHGSVVDLQISALETKAMVSGSSIYKVTVTIKALAPTVWRSICKDCAGGIDSLVELLQGRFSKGVMERICRQDRGLFPKPSEIRFSCSCPDGASMCKHVAAVLYGIGARLDGKPELLFRLRGVDENDLVADLDKALPFSNQPLDARNVLKTDDISALFGLNMDGSGDAIASNGASPAAPKATDQTERKHLGMKAARRKPEVAPCQAADAKMANNIEELSVDPNTPLAKRTSKSHGARKTTKGINAGKPTERPPSPDDGKVRTASRSVKGAKKRETQKPRFELTPDGFVKWWK